MLPKVLYRSGNVFVKQEEPTNRNRGKFRHLARKISGEVFDVPDDNIVLFMYEKKYGNEFHFGQITFSLADLKMKDPGIRFDSDFFPQISFLFIHRDFQGQGYGRVLLRESLTILKSAYTQRPVRLQSAMDSVGFFEKCGFTVVGEPFDCFHAGSKLFQTLVNMERSV